MGTKVIYTGASESQIRWGSNADPRGVLVEGQEYEIEHTEVHSWHTKVKLVGIDGMFNDVSFRRSERQVLMDEIEVIEEERQDSHTGYEGE